MQSRLRRMNGEAWLLKAYTTNPDLETEVLYTREKSRESLATTGFSKF